MSHSLWNLLAVDPGPGGMNRAALIHRVLVVGHDPSSLERFEGSLKNRGHRAIWSDDPARATILARHFVPSAILLAGDLTDAHAQTLFAQLILHPATARLPIIVVGKVPEPNKAIDLLRDGALAMLPDDNLAISGLLQRLDALQGAHVVGSWVGHAGPAQLRRIAAHLATTSETGDLKIERGNERAVMTFEIGNPVGFAAAGLRGGAGLALWIRGASGEPWSFSFESIPLAHGEAISGTHEALELPPDIFDVMEGAPAPEGASAMRAAPVLSPMPMPPPPDDRAQVLVVEDDPDLRALYCAVLQRAGFKVAEARDGDDGYARALELQPETIVSDIAMPGSDGWALLSLVRDDARVAEARIILVSYDPAFLDDLSRLDAGADEYIGKDVPVPTLVARVAALTTPRRELLAKVEGGDARGFLSEVGVQHVLDAICKGQQTGVLRIEDGWVTAHVYFRSGNLTHAAARVGDLVLVEHEALATIMAIDDAPYLVERGWTAVDETLHAPFRELRPALCETLNERRKRAHEDALNNDAPLELRDAFMAIYLKRCPDAVRPLVRALADHKSPRLLVEEGLAPAALVANVVADLYRKGVVS